MHTIEEVRAEYDRLDSLLGIDTRGIELRISRRAVRQLGSFRAPAGKRSAGPIQIMISALVLEDDAQFWDTVRHEYAHAAVYLLYPGEKHGHDQVWKDVCRRVGCRPRGTAPRTGDAAKKREERTRYIVRCETCGMESRYLRKGKAVEMLLQGRGHRLRCRKCAGNRFVLLER